MKKQYSGKERIFQKEDKIYLNIKNLNLKDEMKKLRHTTKESFLMQRNIKNVIYELRISETKIHKTFNANNFIMTDLTISITKNLGIKNREKKYEVNKILKEKKRKEQTEFFIN